MICFKLSTSEMFTSRLPHVKELNVQLKAFKSKLQKLNSKNLTLLSLKANNLLKGKANLRCLGSYELDME